MDDFCYGYRAETQKERDRYWSLYDVLTPRERDEYDRMALQTALGQDHAVRFLELSQAAEERLDGQA